jgi:hypothetical protein
MILNIRLLRKELGFVFRLYTSARLQDPTLWVTVNLYLPFRQKFTTIRFPTSGLLSKTTQQVIADALALVSDCAASLGSPFREAPYSGDFRHLSKPFDGARATEKIGSDRYTFLGQRPIIDPVFGGQDQTLMRRSRYRISLGFGVVVE